MKRSFIAYVCILALVIAGGIVAVAANADSVVGTWLTAGKDAKIDIYRCGDRYCGKLSWLKNPDDLDTKNPDPARRNDKLLGKDILHGFVFKGDEWVKGKIYDPDSGDTYSCKMWLEGNDVLKVKGYIGVSLLGRSETWARSK
jgi:uncharacterized protein (DUF2147 family)